MYGTGFLPVRRDSLPLATRKVYSDFNTVFVPLLLLAAGGGQGWYHTVRVPFGIDTIQYSGVLYGIA